MTSIRYYQNRESQEDLEPLETVKEQIRLQIWNEQVADNASKLLKGLRSDIQHAEDKMREKADSVICANKEYMSDSFSTFRNGHVCWIS